MENNRKSLSYNSIITGLMTAAYAAIMGLLYAYYYDLNDGTAEKVLSSPIEMLGNIDDTIIYKVNGEMGIYLYNFDTKYMSLVTKRRVKEFVIDKYKEIKVAVE